MHACVHVRRFLVSTHVPVKFSDSLHSGGSRIDLSAYVTLPLAIGLTGYCHACRDGCEGWGTSVMCTKS